MTLGSLLNSHFGSYKTPVHERGEHISYSPPWKGHKGGKGTQSALSALTLLAFLFFLNILQSCLRDQLASQSPLVIMMTTQTTTVTTEAQRHKRDVEEEIQFKGDPADRISGNSKEEKPQYKNLTKLDSFNYESVTKKNENKENESNKIKKKPKGISWLTTSNFSPWLKSIFCCNIFYCPEIQNQNEIRCQ